MLFGEAPRKPRALSDPGQSYPPCSTRGAIAWSPWASPPSGTPVSEETTGS
jgi:hypothetical protein